MTNKKILTLISLLLFLFLLVGCFPKQNLPPEITSTEVTQATVGVEYVYDVDATDPNAGDVLTYSLITEVPDMLINADSGVITWTPDTAGDYPVTVKVEDEGGLFDTQDFTITVSAVELDHIVVLPETMTLSVRGSEAIESVTAHYDDGSTAKLDLAACEYESDNEAVATVLAGVVKGIGVGSATITVSYGDKSDTLEVTVNSILLTSIVVLPEEMTLYLGRINHGSKILPGVEIESVTAHYSDGSEAVLDLDACEYESSDDEVATVSNVGVVDAVYYGTATITVSYTEEEITKTVHIEETDTVEVKVIGRVHNIDANRYYHTITEAITDAEPNDTIEVAAGEYPEVVTVNVEGVTIRGESLDAIVDGSFILEADNITIDGLTILNGFGDRAIFTKSEASLTWGSKGHQIINNEIIGGHWAINIVSCGIEPVDITIDNNKVHDGYMAIMLEGYGTTITNNEFYDNDKTGIDIGRSCDNEISNNSIYNNGQYGIYFTIKGAPTNNVISYNNIYENGIAGVHICLNEEGTTEDKNVINYNNIYGNDEYGIFNGSLGSVDATNNWWGAATGPTHSANPLGTGDKVSDNVGFVPFSTEEN